MPQGVRKNRTRTGCLTCRSRRVKCDEARPVCYNCTRLNRACFYELPGHCIHQATTFGPILRNDAPFVPVQINSTADLEVISCHNDGTAHSTASHDTATAASFQHPHEDYIDQPPPDIFDGAVNVVGDTSPINFNVMTGEWGDLFSVDLMGTEALGPNPSPSASAESNDAQYVIGRHHVPRGLGVGTYHDAQEQQHQLVETVSYFTKNVDPPFITPWDSMNWSRIKALIVGSAQEHPALLAGLKAVTTLYKGLSKGDVETSLALSEYFAAKRMYLSLLQNESADTEVILITTFLLCCFEVVAQQETVSSTLKQKDALITRLEERSQIEPIWSPVSRRIIAWLQLFHAKALHLGGRGILGPNMHHILQTKQPLSAALMTLRTSPLSPSSATINLEVQSQSLFQFYCELQHISTLTSALNRHHRPRGSSEDESKVDELSENIILRLDYLWQERPQILDVEADKISHVLQGCSADQVAQMSLVIRLCRLSYYAEIVYHARSHGRSKHASSPRIIEAKAEIRKRVNEAVAEARNHSAGGSCLHPGFMWPLFLYSVESNEAGSVSWASTHLEMVSNPLWNSAFIISFIRELTNEQLSKGGRIDSRYLCVDRFGVVPPFM